MWNLKSLSPTGTWVSVSNCATAIWITLSCSATFGLAPEVVTLMIIGWLFTTLSSLANTSCSWSYESISRKRTRSDISMRWLDFILLYFSNVRLPAFWSLPSLIITTCSVWWWKLLASHRTFAFWIITETCCCTLISLSSPENFRRGPGLIRSSRTSLGSLGLYLPLTWSKFSSSSPPVSPNILPSLIMEWSSLGPRRRWGGVRGVILLSCLIFFGFSGSSGGVCSTSAAGVMTIFSSSAFFRSFSGKWSRTLSFAARASVSSSGTCSTSTTSSMTICSSSAIGFFPRPLRSAGLIMIFSSSFVFFSRSANSSRTLSFCLSESSASSSSSADFSGRTAGVITIFSSSFAFFSFSGNSSETFFLSTGGMSLNISSFEASSSTGGSCFLRRTTPGWSLNRTRAPFFGFAGRSFFLMTTFSSFFSFFFFSGKWSLTLPFFLGLSALSSSSSSFSFFGSTAGVMIIFSSSFVFFSLSANSSRTLSLAFGPSSGSGSGSSAGFSGSTAGVMTIFSSSSCFFLRSA